MVLGLLLDANWCKNTDKQFVSEKQFVRITDKQFVCEKQFVGIMDKQFVREKLLNLT